MAEKSASFGLIFLLSLLTAGSGCALYYSKPVTDAVNREKLQIGMTPRAVRKAAGEADEVAKRQLEGGNTKEVWVYYEYGPNFRSCTQMLISCSSNIFVPFEPKLQYLVFENEKLIGWNIPDSFALEIIENKKGLPPPAEKKRYRDKSVPATPL